MIPLIKISSEKIDISGSTGSKKSLETGIFSLPQGSACKEYVADTLNILVFSNFVRECLFTHVPTITYYAAAATP